VPTHLHTKVLDYSIQEKGTYFREALERWRELNLSPAFVQFARQTDAFSQSLPLLLHHWTEVVGLWDTAMLKADDEATKPLLECVFPRGRRHHLMPILAA
jgi:U3 small nucleolar RNA-associated protein 20